MADNASLSARTAQAAEALWQARAQRQPVASIAQTFGIDGLDAAYAVADLNTQRRLREPGRRIVGKKVGLTSVAVQRQLGVDQPDFGVLFDDMELLEGDTVPTARLLQPKVEAEVAFVVGHDLGAQRPSWAEFTRAMAYALPALEIVDSAIADWKISLVDTVADNASSALYVLGHQPVDIGGCDLAAVGMQMQVDGQVVSLGTGSACLGHPLRAAYWLACTMAERGQPLRAGEVILSGALGPMVPLAAGQVVHATVGGLGSVSCRMA